MVVLGDRLDALDIRRPVRRMLRRPEPSARPVEQQFWYRSTTFVMRRALPVGLAIIVLLVLLGLPFLGRSSAIRMTGLPRTASAHQVGDQLRNDFSSDPIPGQHRRPGVCDATGGTGAAELDRYAVELSRIADVTLVSAPGGTYVQGSRVGPPSAPTGVGDGSAFLTVRTSAPLYSAASQTQLEALHAVPGPGGREVLIGGSRRSPMTSSTQSPLGCRWCWC